MIKNSFKEFNHIVIGLVLGILLPYIIMYFWLQMYSNLSLMDIIFNPFFSEIINVLKGSLFCILGLFFLFYYLRKDLSARVVILYILIEIILPKTLQRREIPALW